MRLGPMSGCDSSPHDLTRTELLRYTSTRISTCGNASIVLGHFACAIRGGTASTLVNDPWAKLRVGPEVPEQLLMVRAEPQQLDRSPLGGGYQLDEPYERVVRDGLAIGKVNARPSRSRQLFDRIVDPHSGGRVKGPVKLQRQLSGVGVAKDL